MLKIGIFYAIIIWTVFGKGFLQYAKMDPHFWLIEGKEIYRFLRGKIDQVGPSSADLVM